MFLHTLNHIKEQNPELRHPAAVLAARYMVGADTAEDIRRVSKPMPTTRGHYTKAQLTDEEADAILQLPVKP
jgi:hypothetical protein